MKRKADFIMQNIGGENLLIPIGAQVMDMNGIITLNPTAAIIWELLTENRTLDELASTIAEQYDMEFERAYADVQIFINEIMRIGLLEE